MNIDDGVWHRITDALGRAQLGLRMIQRGVKTRLEEDADHGFPRPTVPSWGEFSRMLEDVTTVSLDAAPAYDVQTLKQMVERWASALQPHERFDVLCALIPENQPHHMVKFIWDRMSAGARKQAIVEIPLPRPERTPAVDPEHSLGEPACDVAQLVVTAALKELTEDGRANVMASLPYCRHCWRDLESGETCNCWNDE